MHGLVAGSCVRHEYEILKDRWMMVSAGGVVTFSVALVLSSSRSRYHRKGVAGRRPCEIGVILSSQVLLF